MRHGFPWDAAAALTVRLAGIAAVVWVIVYMSRCYLSGQYLRGDAGLTLIAIMLFVVGAVFAVYCAAADVKKRVRRDRNPKEN